MTVLLQGYIPILECQARVFRASVCFSSRHACELTTFAKGKRFVSRSESEAFAKHTKYAKHPLSMRTLHAGCRPKNAYFPCRSMRTFHAEACVFCMPNLLATHFDFSRSYSATITTFIFDSLPNPAKTETCNNSALDLRVGFMRWLGGVLVIFSRNTYIAWRLLTIPQILITIPGK